MNALDADGSAFVIRLKYECSKTLDVRIVSLGIGADGKISISTSKKKLSPLVSEALEQPFVFIALVDPVAGLGAE